MIRILLLAAVAGGLGTGMGYLQQVLASLNVQERFVASRESLDEIKGKTSREEILQQATGTPKLEVVGGREHYFGMMQHGETMSHDFVIRNVGDSPLTLDLGDSSCTCTVGELDSSLLPPGEETVVKLKWTAKTVLKEFGQYAMVITNDASQREVKLTVRGQIATSFMLEPTSIQLGTLDASESAEREFYVFSYLEDADELTEISWCNLSQTDKFDFEIEKVEIDPQEFPAHVNAKHAHRVRMQVEPGMPIGPINGSVRILTNKGEDIGDLNMIVSGRVAGMLELRGGPSFEPRANLVKLGNVSSSKGGMVSVLLFVRGEERKDMKLEVVSVQPDDALQVEVGEPKDNGSRSVYSIKFVVPQGAPNVQFPATSLESSGKVMLRATIGDRVEELPIKVRLIVRD